MKERLVSNLQGFIAALVCVIIWDFQSFLLVDVFKPENWNKPLFVSWTSGLFLSVHLLIGVIRNECNQNEKHSITKVLNRSALSRTFLASALYFVSNLLTNLAFSATNHTPSVITILQLCSGHTLWIDWLFNHKRPRFINIIGCILLVAGVFGFTFVSPSDSDPLPVTAIPEISVKSEWKAILYANLGVLLFAFYQFMQDSKLKDIPKVYVVGLQGLCMTTYGWIPFVIAHWNHEPLTWPSAWVVNLIIINGIGTVISEYCAVFSVRKTSAFVFVGTLALSSPIAMAMEFIKHEMDHLLGTKTIVKWTWWYVPTLFGIIIGCCLVYYGGGSAEEEINGNLTNTMKESEDSTQDIQSDIEIQVKTTGKIVQRVPSISTAEGNETTCSDWTPSNSAL